MPITYHQTVDNETHEQVRLKHQDKIKGLKLLGFVEFYFFAETVRALGFLPLGPVGFFGVLAALFRDVVKIESNLNVKLFGILMTSMEYATYAHPSALGVKFYTSFTDGTCIISTNFDTPAINDNEDKLYKFAAPRTVAAAWKDH